MLIVNGTTINAQKKVIIQIFKWLWSYNVPGGEIKRDPEIGKIAIRPEPAQAADLSISGIDFLCDLDHLWWSLIFLSLLEISL